VELHLLLSSHFSFQCLANVFFFFFSFQCLANAAGELQCHNQCKAGVTAEAMFAMQACLMLWQALLTWPLALTYKPQYAPAVG